MSSKKNRKATRDKLWGGAFDKKTHAGAWAFGESLASDEPLTVYEIFACEAHVKMLAKQGIISSGESKRLLNALEKMWPDAYSGKLAMPEGAEDIHAAIETLLLETAGEAAWKLHTARSRNDLVATTTRMWLVGSCCNLIAQVQLFQEELLNLSEQHQGALMPGYTHQQPAQPITLGYYLLAYFWMLQRDGWRFERVQEMADLSPLGSAALAGTAFPIDRESTAAELGFKAPIPNALDAVSDRDFVGDALHACAMLMQHLSRLCNDIILWSTAEYGFVTLDDGYSTGSSIMPQKRNPDFAELIRGRTGRVIGHWVAYQTMMKGLPLGYNRDMQEDKPPLFDAMWLCEESLMICSGMLRTLKFNTERMREMAGAKFSTATSLADALAMKGMPFRKAHEVVGNLVKKCIKKGWTFEDLTPERLRKLVPEIPAELLKVLDLEETVRSRESFGGTGPRAMARQLRRARTLLRQPGFKRIV
ncbi:MAG: argininosuccinate lyase [Armatimonadetes bacterium]|nr:argininosuccinate lyase [Armatimonadota bacterium]